jgi:hypothetical protein
MSRQPSSDPLSISKRASPVDVDLLRPAKRANILGSSLDLSSYGVHPQSSRSVMDGLEEKNSAKGVVEEAEDHDEVAVKRIDKGKGRAQPPVELPEVVWTRVFEYFYDSVCQGVCMLGLYGLEPSVHIYGLINRLGR